ncbi:MAG TPA: CsbD family protein [Nakamurella sp.]
MGMGDRIKHTAEEAKGKVKEATGKATDNHTMQAEGQGDQAAANVKQAGDRDKDALS